MADVVIHPMTADRWDDVVDLFGTRGDPSWCWCQFFLTTGRGHQRPAAVNRAALRGQVESSDRPMGLVAYVVPEEGDDEPGPAVGWVQLGPRPTFPRVTGNRDLASVVTSTDDDLDAESVWAITCFVVKVGHRRKGVGGALLGGAVAIARAHGATAVVGHPVDVVARASGVSGSDLYHGAASTFERAGFRVVGRTGPSRPVVRLDL